MSPTTFSLEIGPLPPIDFWTSIELALGVLSIVSGVISFLLNYIAGKKAEKRLEEAKAQLTIMIENRLNEFASGNLDPRLWTTNSIRGLADINQQEFHSPEITDILI